MDKEIKAAIRLLRGSRKAIALTGAGVGTESGIPDFRSKNGLWSRFDPFEYGTLGAFRKNPEKVWKMLKELLAFADCKPNKGHLAMAELEKIGLLKGIITQNIDGLHQKAGSANVVEFHGSIFTFTCPKCGNRAPLSRVRLMMIPPHCPVCADILKPDVIFFDEQISPRVLLETERLVHGADLLLVAGTSCEVAPASFIPSWVSRQGGGVIEINLSPVLGGQAAVSIAGGFSEIMEKLLLRVRKGQ
ncbi:MAG: NAD-dependent deacylase [Pseudomonadota bacterium]